MMKPIESIAIEIIVEGTNKQLVFNRRGEDDVFTDTTKISLETTLSEDGYCYNAKRIDNIEVYNEFTEDIVERFIDKYNQIRDTQREMVESGIEYIEAENERDTEEEIVPYDPNSIRVTQGRFSLKEIVEMINGTEYEESILDLSPDFQRNFVWDITRKSRLIESILLKIPLPVFYLARDDEGKYQVVDGAQRLTVIKDYFNNKFRLKNLEYLNDDYENKYFHKGEDNSLVPKAVRALRSYQIDCNIIEPETPHKVKLDIFKRLNTGGRSLNRQEIRNAILKKETRKFIKDLAESKEFKEATNYGVKSKRMMDQELVLRFIAFYLVYNKSSLFPEFKYLGKMDEFLDELVEILNKNYYSLPVDEIKEDFYRSMKNAMIMFGEYAFRKVEHNYQTDDKNMVNKSLFTCLSVLLCRYDASTVISKGTVVDKLAKEISTNKYLYESISYATNDAARIDTAFLQLENLLKRIYG